MANNQITALKFTMIFEFVIVCEMACMADLYKNYGSGLLWCPTLSNVMCSQVTVASLLQIYITVKPII